MLIPTLLCGLAIGVTAQDGPPGLVFVKGGKTKIGSDLEDVEPFVVANRQFAATFAGEVPQHQVKVEDFYLMPNEVTNEQYAEFVRATGYMPPYYWGEEALDAGRVAFLEEQGKARQEAIAAGEKPPERKEWEPAKWWAENWKSQDWEVPTKILDSPVTFVAYPDAEAYARWAGLRLMTEFEFQRAGRGNTDRQYPWGGDWEDARCNSLEHPNDEPMPVGSFEEGAVDGIYDLVGNVWEWTSSKYNKFPGYEPLEFRAGRDTIKGLAGFEPTYRVLVGGSYTNQAFACRLGVRMGSMRRQTTEAVGFRCALDVQPGLSTARWILDEDVRLGRLPGDIDFKAEGSAILQRWQTSEGTASVPGYAVIEKYQRVVFTPITALDAGSDSEFGRKTKVTGPAILGMLAFEFPLMAPELDGGVYFVAWRGANKLPKTEDKDEFDIDPLGEVSFHQVPGFEAEEDQLFLYDLEGQPLVAWNANPIKFQKPKAGSSMTYVEFVPPEEEPDEDAPPIIPMDTLRIDAVVDAKSRKALHTAIELKLSPGTLDSSWK